MIMLSCKMVIKIVAWKINLRIARVLAANRQYVIQQRCTGLHRYQGV